VICGVMSTLISKISGYILDKKHLSDCFTLRIHDEWVNIR
jgi:hypothetical protein